MTRHDFIVSIQNKVEEKTGNRYNQNIISDMANAFCETIKEILVSKDSLELAKFMSFGTKLMSGREVIVPFFGKDTKTKIDDYYRICIKPAKALKDAVNGNSNNKKSGAAKKKSPDKKSDKKK